MVVYVNDCSGRPLKSTERFGKVRRLLKEKKAKVVNKSPFTIQLLYEIDNKGDKPMKPNNLILDTNTNFKDLCIKQYKEVNDLQQLIIETGNSNTIKELKQFIIDNNDTILEHFGEYDYESLKQMINKNELTTENQFTWVCEAVTNKNDNTSFSKFPQFFYISTFSYGFTIDYLSPYYNLNKIYKSDQNTLSVIIEYFKTHEDIFKEKTITLIELLEQIQLDENNVYAKYTEFIDNFIPIILFVTNNKTIPKLTAFPSLVMSIEDFLLISDKNKECPNYPQVQLKPHYLNLFGAIFLDAEYFEDFGGENTHYESPNFILYTVNDDTTYQKVFDLSATYKYNSLIDNLILFDKKDYWTEKDCSEYFKTHSLSSMGATSKIVMKQILERVTTYTKEEIFKPDYIVHEYQIVYDENLYEINKEFVLKQMKSLNPTITYLDKTDYLDPNFFVDYEQYKDAILIEACSTKYFLPNACKRIRNHYNKNSQKAYLKYDYQEIVDGIYYIYKDMFGKIRTVKIDKLISVNLHDYISEKTYDYNYLKDVYTLNRLGYGENALSIATKKGYLTVLQEYVTKIEYTKKIMEKYTIFNADDLDLVTKSTINYQPTILYINKKNDYITITEQDDIMKVSQLLTYIKENGHYIHLFVIEDAN